MKKLRHCHLCRLSLLHSSVFLSPSNANEMESLRTCPWPRDASRRTTCRDLGLSDGGQVLGLDLGG